MKKFIKNTDYCKGQTVIILLLIVVVALGIGLSVVGRSISEISISTKTEESTRAFSAAEAGVEKALQQSASNIGIGTAGSLSGGQIPLTNQAQAQVNWNPSLPENDCGAGVGCPLEIPPFGKESFGQIWLASPTNSTAEGFPVRVYSQNKFKLYFGSYKTTVNNVYIDDDYYKTNPDNKPALSVTVVYRNGNAGYGNINRYYDSTSTVGMSSRNPNFEVCKSPLGPEVKTNSQSGDNSNFYCMVEVDGYPLDVAANIYPVLVRVRLLYTDLTHPIAIGPISGSLPPQASIITSTGSAGSTQRTLEVFQQKSVMPDIFDYVLFSAGTLNK